MANIRPSCPEPKTPIVAPGKIGEMLAGGEGMLDGGGIV
jgi:hypothetical protein